MILDIIGIGAKLIDKLIPDPQAKAEAKLKLLELEATERAEIMRTDLAVALAQAEVNKVEAADPNVFKSGWRPAVGWVSVAGLAYTFLGQPLLTWASAFYNVPAPPSLDMNELFILLSGMLGLGGFRSFEKSKKVA